ncbi:hypothetical protein BGX34_008363 [Mortierella sp. NVP85]|nr:hypothetical protein BGX34_008363 [Mortierella sp. NVP85]
MATDIPELIRHIVQYLDSVTLKAFSLVCKAWYLNAQPILWSHFVCRVPQKCSESPEEYALWLDTIRKNAISFRHISYLGALNPTTPEIYDILLGRCHGLVSITTYVVKSHFLGPIYCWEDTLASLIKTNRVTLQRLDLRLTEGLPMTFLRSLLTGLQHLRSLELSARKMMVEDLLAILDALPSSLESLSLATDLEKGLESLIMAAALKRRHPGSHRIHSSISSISSIPSIAKPLRLKYLSIPHYCFKGIMEDVLSRLAAHSLQGLQISTMHPLRISPTIRDALWRLTSLHLQEFQSGDGWTLPGILEAIHPHQLRRLYVYRMNTESAAMLIEKQHQSLESLTLHLEEDHAGALADILATCRRLKSLTFSVPPFVDIRTLIDPQKPWVCAELEIIKGYFGLPRPVRSLASDEGIEVTISKRIEEQFMRRLGRLTNLRCLVQNECYLGPICASSMIKEGIMEWSLTSGLGHLHGLVNLRTFKVLNRGPQKWIGVPEMMFIKQHWQSLRVMVCNDVGDIAVQEWLVAEWPELKASAEKYTW